jgi:hypothetical protein
VKGLQLPKRINYTVKPVQERELQAFMTNNGDLEDFQVTKAANVSYEEGGVRKQLDQSVQKIWSLNEWVQPGLKKVLGQFNNV